MGRKLILLGILGTLLAMSLAYSTKSKFKPGYGVYYEYRGNIVHSMNVYWKQVQVGYFKIKENF